MLQMLDLMGFFVPNTWRKIWAVELQVKHLPHRLVA